MQPGRLLPVPVKGEGPVALKGVYESVNGSHYPTNNFKEGTMGQLEAGDTITIGEVAKRTHNGDVLIVANNLSKFNKMLEDAPWLPANNGDSHIHLQTLLEPAGEFRIYNAGVGGGAGITVQVEEPTAMMERYSTVDQALIDMHPEGQRKAVRTGEELIFLRGLAKTMATAVIYGNRTTTPEKINGFTTRYNALALTNVEDGGDSGSASTSLWIIQWGADSVFFCYPSSSQSGGIQAKDLGIRTVTDASDSTKEFEAYRTHFKIHWGIVVRDDRAVQRIVSIDPVYGQTNDLDETHIVKRLNQLPDPGNLANTVIYCNRDVKTSIDILALAKSNGFYTMPNIFGQSVSVFQGVPIKLMEAITSTETAI